MNRPLSSSVLLLSLACGTDEPPATTGPTEPVLIDCSTLELDVPPGISEIQGVWDAPLQRMVFFGGDQGQPIECVPAPDFAQETWAFYPHCEAFARIAPEGGPSPRGRFAATLDATRRRMILFGGRSREADSGPYTLHEDTWALDLATDTWTELDVGRPRPPRRSNHAMITVGDQVFLFGGNRSEDPFVLEPLDDTWVLDLTTDTWSRLTLSGNTPAARLYHAAATDGQRMFVYGGADASGFVGPFLGDLFALDLQEQRWSRLHGPNNGAPPARFWSTLVHDAERDRLLMFGGHDTADLGNNNELWAFELASESWSLLRQGDTLNGGRDGACGLPLDFANIDYDSPDRRNAGMAIHTETDMLLFGGKTDCGLINDVWALELASDTWRELSRATEGEACLRAYDDCTELCF